MAEQSRFQLALHLSLLENATNTFIKSFAAWCFILKMLSHSRTKLRGSHLDCHSFSCWQGTGYFMMETEENIMQCGQWKTSCIGRMIGAPFCSCLTSIMNSLKRALNKSITVELRKEDHPWNETCHPSLVDFVNSYKPSLLVCQQSFVLISFADLLPMLLNSGLPLRWAWWVSYLIRPWIRLLWVRLLWLELDRRLDVSETSPSGIDGHVYIDENDRLDQNWSQLEKRQSIISLFILNKQ